MEMKHTVIDTNLLLEIETIEKYVSEYKFVILADTLRELEKHKTNHRDANLAYQARKAVRWIEKNSDNVKFDLNDYKVTFGEYEDSYIDNRILQSCLSNNYSIATSDLLLKMKCKGFGIDVIELKQNKSENEYAGWLKVKMSEQEMANFYQSLLVNTYNLEANQYILVHNEYDEFVDLLKWDGYTYASCGHKPVSTSMFGKLKPYDHYQQMAIDSILSNQITMIKGKAGTGKSLISLSVAWSLIEKGKFDKLYIISNPVPAGRNASKLGFLPGTRDEKLLSSNLGSILMNKFGDLQIVQSWIASGKIVLLPLADARGVDVQNAIVWSIESQNMDRELIKIMIQRISETSKLILDGDYNQVDADIFDNEKNGMRRVSEVFKGREMYGEVNLPIVYRSKIAEIADLI